MTSSAVYAVKKYFGQITSVMDKWILKWILNGYSKWVLKMINNVNRQIIFSLCFVGIQVLRFS